MKQDVGAQSLCSCRPTRSRCPRSVVWPAKALAASYTNVRASRSASKSDSRRRSRSSSTKNGSSVRSHRRSDLHRRCSSQHRSDRAPHAAAMPQHGLRPPACAVHAPRSFRERDGYHMLSANGGMAGIPIVAAGDDEVPATADRQTPHLRRPARLFRNMTGRIPDLVTSDQPKSWSERYGAQASHNDQQASKRSKPNNKSG